MMEIVSMVMPSLLVSILRCARRRRCLHQMLMGQRDVLDQLNQLTPDRIAQLGVKALALDVDGVLSTHGAVDFTHDAHTWLKQCHRALPQLKLFIYSNNLFAQRRHMIEQNYPWLVMIEGPAKKPDPSALHQAATAHGLSMHEICVVDDRLTTGVLAALEAGARPLWLLCPVVGKAFQLSECYFSALRWLERQVFRVWGRSGSKP